jgi:DNA-binding response OmpR family regulator
MGAGRRILIVEDVAELADLYRVYLEHEGLEARTVGSAEEALALMERGPHSGVEGSPWDLVILDLNLPGMDGFAFLERFRGRNAIPVMILTARSADEDVLRGLESGADDFVFKPCPPRVLAARVRSRLARDRERSLDRDLIRFGAWTVDKEAQLVYRGGRMLALSPREYGVFLFLVERGGKPASPSLIYAEVWRQEYGDESAVGVIVQRIRRKLEEDPDNPAIIQTIFRQGYRIDPSLLDEPPLATGPAAGPGMGTGATKAEEGGR